MTNLNPDRWTLKTQEAFSQAAERAKSANHAEITPDHLLAAVLSQVDGIAPAVLTRVGVEPAVILNRIEGELARLPQAYRRRAARHRPHPPRGAGVGRLAAHRHG